MSSLVISVFYFHNYFTTKTKKHWQNRLQQARTRRPASAPALSAVNPHARAPTPPTPRLGSRGGVAVCAPARRGPTATSLPAAELGFTTAVGAAPQAPPPAGARAGARAPGDGPPALTGRRLRRPLGPRLGESRYGGRRAGATSEGRTALGP